MTSGKPAGDGAGVNRAGAARGEAHLLAALRGELARWGVDAHLEQGGLWSRLRVCHPSDDPAAGFDLNVIVASLGGQRCYCWPRAIPIGPVTQLTRVAGYITAALTQTDPGGTAEGEIASLTVYRLLREAREDIRTPMRRQPRPARATRRAPRTGELAIPPAANPVPAAVQARVRAPQARSQQIMALPRELGRPAATPAQIAAQAAASQRRLTQAMAALRDAPDLADAVTAGRLTLTAAYRNTRARTRAAPDLDTLSYLTAGEMAGLLRVSPMTVYRLIASGDLDATKAGASWRIPAPAARRYLARHTTAAPAQATGHASTQGPAQPGAAQGAADPGTPPPAGARGNQERLLAPAEVGVLFGVDPRTVTIWANHGLLTPVRTPGGHRRYRDADVAALLTGTDAAHAQPRADPGHPRAGHRDRSGGNHATVRRANGGEAEDQVSARPAHIPAKYRRRSGTHRDSDPHDPARETP